MEEIPIILNKKQYILGDILFTKAPIYCKMCRSTRDIIKRKNIDATNYIFARFVNDKWIIADGKCPKYDKILFTDIFMKTIDELNGSANIKDDNNIEKAPNILELLNNEKFKDDNGNIIEIETRGDRKVDNIYFKVKDIMIGFEMENLQIVILNNNRDGYNEGIHYKFFNCKKNINDLKKTSTITSTTPNFVGSSRAKDCTINESSSRIKINSTIKKELFLTYEGILRVLFASHSKKVKPFIKWTTETLFTIQMGSKDQKEKLVGDVLGVSAKVIKEVFNCDTNTIPCVYLFTLGYVKDLRTSMNIDNKYKDDSIVAKYGFTKELSRRTAEHIKTYSKINECDLKLKHYSYIDPQYISNGEVDIKDFIIALNLKLSYENFDELIVIPKEYNKMIAEKYDHIGKKYAGHISELITKIKELEDKNEKQELKHMYEIQKITYEKDKLNNELELQKEKYEHKLLQKDFELLKIQKIIN
jgi:hypothetical protein